MTRKFGKTVLAAAILCSLPGATGHAQDLVTLVNQHFPPVSPVDNQIAALKGAALDIQGIGSALLYTGVSLKDLQTYLPDSIQLKEADLAQVAVTLGQQEVVVTSGFELQLQEGDVRITGSVEVHCAASVEEGSLVLRPSASKIEVKSIDNHETQAPDVLVSAINALLDAFLLNLNGAIQALRVPLQLSSVQTIDTAQLLAGLDLVSSAQGTKIGVDVSLGNSAVLIDPQGIHVLADAIVLTRPEADTLAHELTVQSLPPPARALAAALSANQAALPSSSLCSTLPDYPDTRVQRLRKLCAGQRLAAASLGLKSAAVPQEESLDVLFTQYKKAFLDKAALIDNQENLFWDQTAVAISRRSLAVDMNKVLALAQSSASLHFPHYEGDVKETILTPPTTDLKCEQNAGGCDSDFQFRPYEPRGCDSDCSTTNCFGPSWARVCVPGVDLACQGRKVDCERLKEQERLAYEAEKAMALAAWTVTKNACELAKATKLTGCQLNQAWLNGVGGQDVGEVQAHWQADDGEIHLSFDGLHVGDNLDSFAAHATVSGGANLGADFTLVPHNAGNLVCVAQWSGRVHATALLPTADLNLTGNMTSTSNEGGRLILTFALSGQSIDFKVQPPPVLALLSQNPQIAAYCPVPAAIVASWALPSGTFNPVGLFATLALDDEARKDTFPYEIKERNVSLEIPERTLLLGGHEVQLVPLWQPSSIVILARPPEAIPAGGNGN